MIVHDTFLVLVIQFFKFLKNVVCKHPAASIIEVDAVRRVLFRIGLIPVGKIIQDDVIVISNHGINVPVCIVTLEARYLDENYLAVRQGSKQGIQILLADGLIISN